MIPDPEDVKEVPVAEPAVEVVKPTEPKEENEESTIEEKEEGQ